MTCGWVLRDGRWALKNFKQWRISRLRVQIIQKAFWYWHLLKYVQNFNARLRRVARGKFLAQLDELAAAISRHARESKEALAKLDYGNSPIQPS